MLGRAVVWPEDKRARPCDSLDGVPGKGPAVRVRVRLGVSLRVLVSAYDAKRHLVGYVMAAHIFRAATGKSSVFSLVDSARPLAITLSTHKSRAAGRVRNTSASVAANCCSISPCP